MAPQSNLRRANRQDPRQPLLARREGRDCSLRLNLTSRRKEFSLSFSLCYRLYLPLSLFYSPFYLRYLFLSSLLYELLMFLSPFSSCLTILGLYSTWVLANESHIIVLHSFHRLHVPAAALLLKRLLSWYLSISYTRHYDPTFRQSGKQCELCVLVFAKCWLIRLRGGSQFDASARTKSST